MDLEEVWRIREEEVYPRLFGPGGDKIATLSQQLFADRFGYHEDFNVFWMFDGVMEFGPTTEQPFWKYVTSGYSNPWDVEPELYNPNAESGSGVEFLFATRERGDWAISFLQNMLAFELLLCIGKFGGKPLDVGHRIPLHSPINGVASCEIRNAMIAAPGPPLPADFSLPSGQVRFLCFMGVTDGETAYAKENGNDALIGLLREAKHYPVTDPARKSVV